MATVVIYEQQVLMNRVTLEAPFQTKCITLREPAGHRRVFEAIISLFFFFFLITNLPVLLGMCTTRPSSLWQRAQPTYHLNRTTLRCDWWKCRPGDRRRETWTYRDVGWKPPAGRRWSDAPGYFGRIPIKRPPPPTPPTPRRWVTQRASCWPQPPLITSHLNVQPRVTCRFTGLPVYMLP